ncbi:hypothetical protein H6P81_000717 [Aristolochia fimbriata]|uniref:RING-type domain-containing protein n=1 Tax=Aristolochia fimbriata TaxID=158543 RepID=A0AAV7F5P3_ARIFI|nr:hypothetical protein H6P81_000717 [Aristolochia fimbriata]
MGSGGSRLTPRSPRSPRSRRLRGGKRLLAAIVCGGSRSRALDEMEDAPVDQSASSNCFALESSLILSSDDASSSVDGNVAQEGTNNILEDLNGSRSPPMSNMRKFMSESKELIPSQSNNVEVINTFWERRNETGCTSKEVHNCGPHLEVGNSSTENDSNETVVPPHNSGLNSVPNMSGDWQFSGTDQPERETSSMSPVAIRHHGNENVLQVDVVSISSNILAPSSSAEINSQEARRNSRRLFWDAFSRRSSRRHSGSSSLVLSSDDSDDTVGSRDRWLFDFNGDVFNNGFGDDSAYLSNRSRTPYERRWSRSQFWERLRGSLDENRGRTTFCASGLHPDGTCSCEAFFMSEESGTRASISRIVLLAEALFEVLDEIHRQPVSLSLSVVSVPAPEAIVNSLPLKSYCRTTTVESGDDMDQCYICLVEYEEEEKIRVLPCHHEFHMSCIDKWLKEIHGVCPLCRRDVCEAAEGCSSNS